MKIMKTQNASAVTLALEGRLDSTTAPELETDLKDFLDDASEIVFDMEKLDYISSAGLRVLLSAQKVMVK
ncbi:MAG: STAS domain-containing protein, partial [Clostridia bacterium]|nr:STAS domain-containing protein [Clostridia bacterium]